MKMCSELYNSWGCLASSAVPSLCTSLSPELSNLQIVKCLRLCKYHSPTVLLALYNWSWTTPRCPDDLFFKVSCNSQATSFEILSILFNESELNNIIIVDWYGGIMYFEVDLNWNSLSKAVRSFDSFDCYYSWWQWACSIYLIYCSFVQRWNLISHNGEHNGRSGCAFGRDKAKAIPQTTKKWVPGKLLWYTAAGDCTVRVKGAEDVTSSRRAVSGGP